MGFQNTNMKRSALLTLLLTIFTIWGCMKQSIRNAESAKFEIVAKEINTKIETANRSAIFYIQPNKSMGSATIKNNSDIWPRKVVVRFQSFPDVLYIDNGTVFLKISGHWAPESKKAIVYFGEHPESQAPNEIPSSHPYWINVVSYNNYLELSLPKKLFDNDIKFFNVGWITFMR